VKSYTTSKYTILHKKTLDVYTREGEYVGMITARPAPRTREGEKRVTYSVAVTRQAQEMFAFA